MKPTHQTELRPASFDTSKKKLSDGELALLALMKKKIESEDVISHNDILRIYRKHIQRFDKKETYISKKKGYGWRPYRVEEIDQMAKAWFKRCLGDLILKAKLVVIPVIDLN